VNRQTKRLLQRQGQLDEEGAPAAGGRRPPPTRRPPGGPGGPGGRDGGADRPGLPERVVEFSREVRNELAKVAWPNRKEVVKYTVVVFFTLVFMTSLVFGLDAGFAKGVLFLFGY
jgi:preprotein translocase subunit SecE